jgi:hypothetical protein
MKTSAEFPEPSFFFQKWEAYLEAFTQADYSTLANQFHYPVSILFDNPLILLDEASFIKSLKFIREHKLQPGYSYSKTNSIQLVKLTEKTCYVDVVYSRYNQYNESIFQGRGLYFFQKINEVWKIQINMPIS